MKTSIAIVALVASLLTIVAGRQLLQSGTARVTFFDNGNYSGGGQAFSTDVPATGCGSCENLVRLTPQCLIRTSPTSWPTLSRTSQTPQFGHGHWVFRILLLKAPLYTSANLK